ncbi:MAG: hypothetical protein AAGK78_02665 [Planctomycetota bacterium]
MAATALPASADVMNFTVDPSQSSLTVSGSLGNGIFSVTAAPQFAGSDVATLQGNLQADVTATSISFTGGSAIDADVLATPVAPGVGGVAGTGPGDLGFVFAGLLGAVNVDAAGRDLLFDVASGPAVLGTGGAFSAAANLSVLDGDIDFNGVALGEAAQGSVPLDGEVAPNVTALDGTLVEIGGLFVLTLPVEVTFEYEDDGFTGSLLATGQIVATAPVPEPTSLTVLAVAGLALRRRR